MGNNPSADGSGGGAAAATTKSTLSVAADVIAHAPRRRDAPVPDDSAALFAKWRSGRTPRGHTVHGIHAPTWIAASAREADAAVSTIDMKDFARHFAIFVQSGMIQDLVLSNMGESEPGDYINWDGEIKQCLGFGPATDAHKSESLLVALYIASMKYPSVEITQMPAALTIKDIHAIIDSVGRDARPDAK
jgi:hypothetical protein